MAWTTYAEPIEILSATDINNIQENIEIIRNLLIEKGLVVGNTSNNIRNIEAYVNTKFIEIFDILFNIEYNLNIISDNICKSAYYVEPKIIGDYASNRDDIWRWIQILNDMYGILTNEKGKWQYLLCNDGLPTIENKKILLRGDVVG